MSESRLTYAERRARWKRELDEALAESGVTPHEFALFIVVQYGIHVTPPEVPRIAASDCYHPDGPADEADTRAALAACLAKGWLRVVDQAALAEIRADVEAGGLLGPIYGFPPVGTVDFAPAGAALWLSIHARTSAESRTSPGWVPFAYTDVVHAKTARYYRTLAAANEGVDGAWAEEGVVSVAGPTPTGPWRAQWWQRFPEGYRIDVEERRCWQGRATRGGEDCFQYRFPERADPSPIQDALDRCNVTLAEWAVLKAIENGPHRFKESDRPRLIREFWDGLDACLRKGWVRVLGRRVIEGVRTLLRDDPALLALPKTAELRPPEHGWAVDPDRPGHLIPVPRTDDYRYGEIDFTPVGAAVYRIVSTAWLGPGWEDDLQVSNGYYREEHRYCESEEGFRNIVPEYEADGWAVRTLRVVPIGPWCVHWWQRFPAGYRLELAIGDPVGPPGVPR